MSVENRRGWEHVGRTSGWCIGSSVLLPFLVRAALHPDHRREEELVGCVLSSAYPPGSRHPASFDGFLPSLIMPWWGVFFMVTLSAPVFGWTNRIWLDESQFTFVTYRCGGVIAPPPRVALHGALDMSTKPRGGQTRAHIGRARSVAETGRDCRCSSRPWWMSEKA